MWQRIYKAQSQYQLIELFFNPETGHLKLELNCCLQFHSADEYRYHELIVFAPYVVCAREPKRVCILGGGDGLAVREALKFAEKITLVDIDPEVTRLAKEHELVRALNGDSLNNERVKIYNADAFYWVKDCRPKKYDIIIADYPDPSSLSLEKLYSDEHYADIKRALKPDGVFICQATGPSLMPCMATIGAKLKKLWKYTVPLKVEMLSGVHGFWLATDNYNLNFERLNNIETKAFDKQMFLSASSWGKDLREMLKSGDPEASVYDMYVYSLCLFKGLIGQPRR